MNALGWTRYGRPAGAYSRGRDSRERSEPRDRLFGLLEYRNGEEPPLPCGLPKKCRRSSVLMSPRPLSSEAGTHQSYRWPAASPGSWTATINYAYRKTKDSNGMCNGCPLRYESTLFPLAYPPMPNSPTALYRLSSRLPIAALVRMAQQGRDSFYPNDLC